MRLLDTATAAVALGCSERRIRRLVRRGLLTNHGSGWRILVDLAEVQERIHCGDTPASRAK